MEHSASTYFRLMPARYAEIAESEHGFECTGMSSIAFDGQKYFQAGHSDDWGLAELVPAVARATGWSLARSFDVTELILIVLSVLVGFGGLWKLSGTRRARRAAVCVTAGLLVAMMLVADVYVFQAAPLTAGLPWLVYFARSGRVSALISCATCFVFCCSWFSFVRSGTLLISLAFLVPLAFVMSSLWKRFLILLVACLACVPATIFSVHQTKAREAFLAKLGQAENIPGGHPLWHSIYIGLAFIPNSEVTGYRDEVAIAKVASVDPSVPYMSAQYDSILRAAVFDIVRRKPWIVMENLAAKTVIMCLLALFLLWPVRKATLMLRKMSWLEWSFALSVLGAANGIVVIPRLKYVLSLICLTALYSAIRYIETHTERPRLGPPRLSESEAAKSAT